MRLQARTLSVAAVCSTLSLVAGFALGASHFAGAQGDKAPVTTTNPQEKVLYSNLYMQTSAEYTAVCTQIYALASEQLRRRLSALPTEESTDSRTPAIIMDLDETVLDNGGYESFVDRERMNFTVPTWNEWEKNHADEVGLIPGAKEFIEYAERNGVSVVYLSNRSKVNQASTIAAIKANGLSTENIENRLLLQEDKAPSDKTSRRKIAAERYRVIMLFGDNLRDFSEQFAAPKLKGDDDAGQKAAITDRKAKVNATRFHWGVDWFILPNPVYGEWEKLLGDSPRLKMRPTKMPAASSIK